MKIAICDDNLTCLNHVSSIAREYIEQHPEKGLIPEFFSHPEDLMESAEKLGGFDLYILDIVMPGMTGIELGIKLRNDGYDGKIIYVTSSEEYSLEAFRVKAFDYIIKPITRDVFFNTVNEAIASLSEKKDKSFILKAKDRSVKLTYDSIMYAELNKRMIRYYLTNGRTIDSLTIRTTFSQATTDLLSDKRFTACGQSMVVNMDYITEIENSAIVFGNTYRAFLGEKLCRKLRDTWSEYLFSQEG